jgi:hypothetical protein
MFPLFQTELDRLHAEVDRCGQEKTRLHEALMQNVPSSSNRRVADKPEGA